MANAGSLWQTLYGRPFPGDPADPAFNVDLAAWDAEAAGVVDGIVRGNDVARPAQLRSLRARLSDLACFDAKEQEYVADWMALLDLLLDEA